MAKSVNIDSSVKFFITVIGLAVIGFVLKELSHIFIPFVIAYFLYFLFAPLNSLLTRHRVPLAIVTILDIAILVFVFWVLSRVMIDSFMQFADGMPFYLEKLSALVRDTASSAGITDPYFSEFSILKMIENINYEVLAGGLFSSTFSFAGTILFIIFFFVFVVTGHNTVYEAIKNRFVNKRVMPEIKKMKKKLLRDELPGSETLSYEEKINLERLEREERLAVTFRSITEKIQRYIIAKIVINLSAGIVIALFYHFAGLEFPVVWGLFTFLFNFIPSIGSAIALVLPSLMAVIQFETFSYAVMIAAFTAGIQTLFFNIIEPSVIGRRLNLNPLLVLLSVLIWGYIWGVVGMLLAVPLTAIIKLVISGSKSKNMKFVNDLMSS